MFKKLTLCFLFMSLLFGLFACAQEEEQNPDERVELRVRNILYPLIMNSTVEIRILGTKAHLDEIERIYRLYDKLANRYETHEGIVNVKTINDHAGIEPVIVSDELLELLETSLTYYALTDGLFNVAIGRISQIWKDAIENRTLPNMETIQSLSSTMNIDYINIVGNEVYLVEGTEIDLGGMAKGFATQKVYEYIQSQGIEKYLVNAGSSSLLVGNHFQDRPWVVGLKDPNTPGSNYKEIEVRDRHISTSGDFEQMFEISGRRYSHIISPLTLEPGNVYKSITLVGHDSALIDMLSTVLFILPLEEAIAFIDDLIDNDVLDATFDAYFYELHKTPQTAVTVYSEYVAARD